MDNRIGIIMNGVTGRMGYRQHLLRSILAIRDDGGVQLSDGRQVQVEPLLVGRSTEKLRRIATECGIENFTTDLDAALSDPRWQVYGDFVATSVRMTTVMKAIEAGKAIYTEKPTAVNAADALELARRAAHAGVKNGVVHDKIYLPGFLKLRKLVDSGFFGRIISVRGDFGYWVFEGDWRESQRPSWNYRTEDGGGIVMDMFPHWNYILENLFGRVESVYAHKATEIPTRTGEDGKPYAATADDAAYAIFELTGGITAQVNSSWTTRVDRSELVQFHVDGVLGSAVAGLMNCRMQYRDATPRASWNPDEPDPNDYAAAWTAVPEDGPVRNGFRLQWEQFLRHVLEDAPHPYDLLSGARGVLLAEKALESAATGRRVAVPVLDAESGVVA